MRVPLMGFSIQDAVYVAIGRIAQSELRKLTSPVVVEDDCILLGPSGAEPNRRRIQRTRYWGVQPSAKLNKELARSDGRSICVAIPPTIRGLLSFARVCASGVERGRQVYTWCLRLDATVLMPQGPDPVAEIYVDVADALQRKPSIIQCS